MAFRICDYCAAILPDNKRAEQAHLAFHAEVGDPAHKEMRKRADSGELQNYI